MSNAFIKFYSRLYPALCLVVHIARNGTASQCVVVVLRLATIYKYTVLVLVQIYNKVGLSRSSDSMVLLTCTGGHAQGSKTRFISKKLIVFWKEPKSEHDMKSSKPMPLCTLIRDG